MVSYLGFGTYDCGQHRKKYTQGIEDHGKGGGKLVPSNPRKGCGERRDAESSLGKHRNATARRFAKAHREGGDGTKKKTIRKEKRKAAPTRFGGAFTHTEGDGS